jgi:hypothetical protein
MKPKSKTRHAAGPDQFLFGLGDDEMGAATREASDADNVLFLKSSSGWWVKRSEHQKLNSDDYPVGFRYELKQRSTTMDSGVGADTRRRFLALPDLLNRRPPNPQNCPPAGQSLSGMTSKPEREPAKTSTSGGAAHDSGQEPTSLGFFSGAPPDERRDGLPSLGPPPPSEQGAYWTPLGGPSADDRRESLALAGSPRRRPDAHSPSPSFNRAEHSADPGAPRSALLSLSPPTTTPENKYTK